MKRKIKILVFLLSCVDLPLCAQYDAHITGHVLDERTGEHLPYVNVQLKGTDKGPNKDANYIYGPSTPRTYFVGCAIKI